MKSFIFRICFFSILLMSCSSSTPVPIAAPTRVIRPTLAPTLIPLTATPVQLRLRVIGEVINCRYGPSVAYALVTELKEGQSARVIGRSENSTWWYIRDPGNPAGVCWVSANVTEIEGETARLTVINPPAIEVSKINLRIEPEKIIVGCNQFPQTVFFESKITTNGPALVAWRLEASTGYISTENNLIFEEAGEQTVNGYYQVLLAGDYWIKIHVLQPNDKVETLNFPANCS